MRLRFWGTRGSIAAPGPDTNHFGGNTSCIELIGSDGARMILDCGTGARLLGDEWMKSKNGPISATILLTHTHWDHIQGFPFFAPLFAASNRFTVRGPEGAEMSLRDVLAGQMEHHYFPVELDELAARISYGDIAEGTYHLDGLRVMAQRMNHPTPTLGYRIEADGGSVCYLSDHEPFFEDVWHDGALAPARIDLIANEGDRRHAEFMTNADVVIHEAQYTPEEYPAKKNWGHSTYTYVVPIAAVAGVRRLFLTHHDPSHGDAFVAGIEQRAQDLARRLGSDMEVRCAYEGCEIVVGRAAVGNPETARHSS
jgi:phosphoribosyl 1,2-cyclic phosphodiesterase